MCFRLGNLYAAVKQQEFFYESRGLGRISKRLNYLRKERESNFEVERRECKEICSCNTNSNVTVTDCATTTLADPTVREAFQQNYTRQERNNVCQIKNLSSYAKIAIMVTTTMRERGRGREIRENNGESAYEVTDKCLCQWNSKLTK